MAVFASTNKSGVADLFDKFRLDLHRHLFLRMNLLADDADDVIQETFIRLMRMEAETNRRIACLESPKAYIFQAATNLAIDRMRRQKVRGDEGDYQTLSDDIEGDSPDPIRTIDAQQRLNKLLHVVDNLPPKCRQVFILHKFKQMSYKEVAQHLDISQSMVEKHMMKALNICDSRLNEK